MQSTWGLAIFLWAVLIGGLVLLGIIALRKTPEQKKKEAEDAKKRREKYLAEEAARKQASAYRPAKGCLQNMIEITLLALLTLVAIVVLIVVVAMS